MKDMMWIYFAIIFLNEAWSLDPGTTINTSLVFNTTFTPITVVTNLLTVDREADFALGSNVSLTCSNRTWNDTMYVIWKIQLNHKTCSISYGGVGLSEDTCKDGKTPQNASNAQSYLHISNFSADDVGIYTCELVSREGNVRHSIKVTAAVPPRINAWLELKDDKIVAMCRFNISNTAAKIRWSYTKKTVIHEKAGSEGYDTGESHLELPDGTNPETLICIIKDKYWEQKIRLEQKRREANENCLWVRVLVAIVVLAGLLLFAVKKRKLRQSQK